MTPHDAILELQRRLEMAIIGQQHVIQRLLLTLLCNGNCLFEGLPGLAKTRAVKSLARHLEAELKRVQFTPDLLLAVDLSGSIAAEDFTAKGGQKVDRLTAAKEVLDEFLTRRKGDRVGLIVFGNAAFVQVLAMVGSRQAATTNGLDTGARSLDASLELVTADNSDVRRLAARATTNVTAAHTPESEARWRDEGYALVPLLVLVALLWAKRGWSIRWHQPLEGNS